MSETNKVTQFENSHDIVDFQIDLDKDEFIIETSWLTIEKAKLMANDLVNLLQELSPNN